MRTKLAVLSVGERPHQVNGRAVRELTEADYDSVLALLSEDPLGGIHLRSMIEDHGLCHHSHRGRFFGYYEGGRLAGVALLGHAILIYAGSSALGHFAQAAADSQATGHVIFGPRTQVETFWEHFSRHGRETKLVREHYWYVCRQPRLMPSGLPLRQATLAALDVVADAHAEMAYEESGTDPRVSDSEGFRRRVAERIERGRVWVKLEGGRVVFKADLASETSDAVYLEGVWTHPDYRKRGIAQSCLSELVCRLARQQKVICLAAEPHEQTALRVYERVGFVRCEDYQARFLKPLQK